MVFLPANRVDHFLCACQICPVCGSGCRRFLAHGPALARCATQSVRCGCHTQGIVWFRFRASQPSRINPLPTRLSVNDCFGKPTMYGYMVWVPSWPVSSTTSDMKTRRVLWPFGFRLSGERGAYSSRGRAAGPVNVERLPNPSSGVGFEPQRGPDGQFRQPRLQASQIASLDPRGCSGRVSYPLGPYKEWSG